MNTSTKKNKIARVATLLLLVLLFAANTLAQTPWQGDGTEQSPYIINNTDELEALADSVNSGTISTTGQFFRLEADLTYDYDTTTQNNHTAIGTQAHPFSGTFDGNNHTISGIRINNDNYYQGLFGYCQNSTVKNLMLTDAKITGGNHVGGIVGYNTNSSVENCHVSNNVTVSGWMVVGTIVGNSYDGNSVENCHVSNNVTVSGSSHIGGIVGQNNGSSSVENCHVSNNVTVSGTSIRIGGIVGVNTGSSVENCHVSNNVTVSSSQVVGGIVGYNMNSSVENCHVSNNVTINGNPFYGTIVGIYNNSTLHRNYYLGCTVNGEVNATDVGAQGHDITENDGAVSGYTIYTATDWDFFCDALQDNDTWNRFIGDTVRLATDIEITRMAGSSTHDFMGTFDGQGHTLTLAYGSAENPITEEYAAPFHNVENGCVIENLHVAGTITTANKYAAGIVAQQYGAVSIRNCRSSVTIQSSVEGDGTHGGLVGVKGNSNNANLTIEGCTFDGKIVSTGTTATTLCGGFVGWRSNSGSLTITNSLYAPTAYNNAVTSGATFARNWTMPDDANCYYTETMGAAQGKLAHSITPGVGVLMEMVGEATGYDISGITSYGTGIMYGSVLYAGNGDEVGLTFSVPEGFSIVSATYTPEGGTTTELTFDDGVYSFTMPDANVVIDAVTESSLWPGQGTEQVPYIITTTEQLETLAQLVNNGNGMAGKYFRLDADLTYDTTTQNNHTAIGNLDHRFLGTFDGNNHTISGIRISNNNNFQGLFGCCGNSIVKNLILTDAQISGYQSVGGIVGLNFGGSVENCHVANNVTVSGSGSVGGIAGITSGSIEDCQVANNVTIDGSGSTGGIVGHNGGGSIEDCQVANNVIVNGYDQVGGIAGGNNGSIEDCQVANNVTVGGIFYVGGIAGNIIGSSIEDCQVAINVAISGNNSYVGTIVGYNENSTLRRNYYLGCTVNGVPNVTNVGTYNGDIIENNGAVPGYLLTLGEHITSDAYAFTIPAYGEMPKTTYHVAPSGDTITLGYELAGCEVTYYVNGNAIADSTFTMPAEDVNVTAVWTDYTIHTAADWELFCDALQDNAIYNRFIGETVILAEDITVTRMAGSDYHDFMGTFDGQGHTLTIAYGTADNPLTEEYAAPFRNLENGAVIHSLHVDGHIYTSNKFASGIAGCQWGTVSVSDCRSSVVIHSSKSGDGTHGGIVAVHHGTLTVSGCVFDGRLLTTNGTTLCAGFVGWRYGTCTLSDCLYAPATDVTLAEGERYITNGATFCRNYSGTLANCYYTETLSTMQGKLALTDPAVLPEGEPTATYDVSDLTFYSNGVQFGEVFYYDPERNFLRTIAGYGTGNNGWNLVASPVANDITPTAANGFLTEEFDLYRFNQAANLEWENWKDTVYDNYHYDLASGRGYLYASQTETTLVFTGTPYSGSGEVTLTKTDGVNLSGWNLVGNPFAETVYLADGRPFYTMNDDGSEIVGATSTSIGAMEAIFVVAEQDGETLTFTTEAPSKGRSLNLNLSRANRSGPSTGSGAAVIDRAIIRFGEGRQLPKFQLRGNSTKLYIPQDNGDYAVVNVGRDVARYVSTIPVNFKAKEDGQYTLSLGSENVEFDYLHLIDNMTGADVDLLAPEPVEGPASYTFTAKTTDYETRFKLVFSANNEDGPSTCSGTFAFISNGNIIVNGEGVLQIVDVTGRIVRCTDVARNVSTAGMTPGVYVLRLINGNDVKTQKMVID